MRRRYVTPMLALVLAVAGCTGPAAKLATAPAEGVIKGRQDAGQLRTLRLRGADGKPIAAGQLQLAGKSYPIKDGEVQLPEAVFQAAQRAGALVVVVPGYAPVRVPTEALVAGPVTLSPLGNLGDGLAISAKGDVSSARGELKLAFGAGMLPGSAKVSLASYRPELAAPNTTAGFQAALQQLYGAAGKSAPGGCDGPFPCPPVQQALGIAVGADATVTGGKLQVSLDLATLLRGWDGNGTPPWTTDPGAWTAAQIADAQAALRILQTFRSLDDTLRTALQTQYGLTLAGTVLSFPVEATLEALAGGFLRVAVPGSELLGTRLEVTLTTPAATLLPVGPDQVTIAAAADEPGVPPAALALAAATLPTADKTGAAAKAARIKVPPLKNTRKGTTIAAGMPLASDPADVGAGAADPGAQPPAALAGIPPVPLVLEVPGVVPGVPSVLANNGSTVLSNNGGAFTPGVVPGLLTNNGGTVVATATGQLLANNGGTLTAMTPAQLISSDEPSSLVNTGGGSLTGFPYVPFVPAIAKFKLFDIGVPLAPAARVSAKGVLEYLWPGGLKLRAIDVAGTALTAWTTTNGDGSFEMPIEGHTPPVFFLEAVAISGGIHLYSQVYAPGSQRGLVAVDSATSLMAISTLHLANFLPAEAARLQDVQASFATQLDETAALQAQLTSGQPRTAARLAFQANLLTEDIALTKARTAELGTAADAFAPYRFLGDRSGVYGAMDATVAKIVTSSTTTAAVYQKMYDLATSGALAPQSLQPINLDSPF